MARDEPFRVKYKTVVEHELVPKQMVNGYLDGGWEPVPYVEHVIEAGFTYVFLRKYSKVERTNAS